MGFCMFLWKTFLMENCASEFVQLLYVFLRNPRESQAKQNPRISRVASGSVRNFFHILNIFVSN